MKSWILKNKDKFIALFVVMIIVAFTYSVVSLYKDHNKDYIEQLETINQNAILASRRAQQESDSAKFRALELNSKVNLLEGSLNRQSLILDKFQKSYNTSLLELNKVKYEKNYIPDNVTYDEQSAYLSNYRYTPY